MIPAPGTQQLCCASLLNFGVAKLRAPWSLASSCVTAHLTRIAGEWPLIHFQTQPRRQHASKIAKIQLSKGIAALFFYSIKLFQEVSQWKPQEKGKCMNEVMLIEEKANP